MTDFIIAVAIVLSITLGYTLIVLGASSHSDSKDEPVTKCNEPAERQVWFPDFNLSKCDILILDEVQNKIRCEKY